jgi:hypothetical protein
MSGGHDSGSCNETAGRGESPRRRRAPAGARAAGKPLVLVKCGALGPPLVTGQLADERLSRPLALGVLSCDGLSYREVVSVYTRAGGSYVVARENFGPRVAQVAAVALLIDYVVTVAVQTAAGSAAIVSAFPGLSNIPVIGPKILLVTSVVAIAVMCLGNLRGLREAGRGFAPADLPVRRLAAGDDRHRPGRRAGRRRPAARDCGIPLELADCPDRRLAHAAARLATPLAAAPMPWSRLTATFPRDLPRRHRDLRP